MSDKRRALVTFLSLVVIIGIALWRSTRHFDPINTHESSFAATESRSSAWPSVRESHLQLHPRCAACGGKDKLNVHHIVSFSVDPSLELESSNLITLCTNGPGGINCHLVVGHAGNFKCRNPSVVADAIRMKKVASSLEGYLFEASVCISRRLCGEGSLDEH